MACCHSFFHFRRQLAGLALGSVIDQERPHQVPEDVQHAAGVFVPESAQDAVRAARVVRERWP